MSVLIKGTEKPDHCLLCFAFRNGICAVEKKEVVLSKGVQEWCPLVEIPPHGDLIDRDKLKNDIPETDADCFENCRDCTLLYQEDVWDIIDDVPTVIESEEQEHE